MELPFKELTNKIIGCAMEVHRTLGPGFQEYIYQRALAIELRNIGIKFEEEFEFFLLVNLVKWKAGSNFKIVSPESD